MIRTLWRSAAFLCFCLLTAETTLATPPTEVDPVALRKSVNRAIDYLASKGQADDGSFSGPAGPGVTSLVTTAMLRHGKSPNDPTIRRALKYLESFVRSDGGIYPEGSFYRNYETCLAMLCFSEANRDGRFDKLLKGAEAFVKGIQWDGNEGIAEDSFEFGGAGYGKHKRPDLSNTSFLVEVLHTVGNDGDDEAIKAALLFVSRCQNHESPHNTTPFGAKDPDGGFYYTPASGGFSQAGNTAAGGLRSYGSMTYAGLKSMIYAGVDADDPRVKAAIEWLRKNYDLETNPGMGTSGLYYYYHMLAKALDAAKIETLTDDKGVKHHWRAELVARLVSVQRSNGSWVNDDPRWLEGDANLVTGYALLALSYCRTESQTESK